MMLKGKDAVLAFRNPPSELYPVPWWSWKGEMQFPEMLRQLDRLQAQHIHEFFIFGSTTLIRPAFFSEEWFEYVEFTLKEAEKRGMKVWIYDDLNWPSGSGGGYVVKNHPEKREFQLRYSSAKLKPGAYKPILPVGLLLAQWEGADGSFREAVPDEYGYFTNADSTEGTLHFVHFKPNMNQHYFNEGATASGWGQRGQLDLLDPEAFRLWMDFVYGEYERRFGKYFGTLIRGFFTDEPQAHSFDGPTAPFNEALRTQFRKMHGYDPLPHLLKVFISIEGSEAFRRDYFSALTELFSSNFAALGKWCRERNLLLTGHCIYEEVKSNMQSFALRNGDPHRLMSKFSAPGCDLLGHTVPYLKDKPGVFMKMGGTETFNSTIFTAKYVSSTARWSGAERTMCEAFGVRNGHSGMQGQKLVNDFLAAAGINLVNDNGLSYTMAELERGGHGIYVPWWNLYHLFYDTSARLSCFSSFGKLAAKTAILVPLTTIWSRTRSLNWGGREFAREAALFNNLSEVLLRNKVDFEYVFEDAPDADALGMFDTIFLPGTDFISPEVASRLDLYRANGGKIVALGSALERTDGAGAYQPDVSIQEPAEALAHVTPSPYSVDGEGAEDILCALRHDGEQHWLLMANQTEGVKTISVRHCLGAVTEMMDPETGRIYEFPEAEGPRSVTLCEGQSVILRIAETPSDGVLPRRESLMFSDAPEREILNLEGDWDFEFGGCNLAFPELSLRFDPMEQGLKERWYANPPKEWFAVTADQMPIDMCRRECMHYWMRGEFTLKDRVPANLSLAFSNGGIQNVFVNGVECVEREPYLIYDHQNLRYPIASAAHPGRNEFYVRIQIPIWNDPLLVMNTYTPSSVLLTLLCGDFSVAPDGTLTTPPNRIPADGWLRHGLPSIARPAVYRKFFELETIPDAPVLEIEDARSTVEVTLNGIALQPRGWRPFRFDLRDALKQGRNDLEIRVTAGFGNILKRGSYAPPTKGASVDYGLMGKVCIKGIIAD